MNNKETEQLLKSLESLLEKEANGENIDQEILINTSENGQWVLEKGIKSRLASALGAIKEKAKKMREKKPTSISQDQHGKYDGGEAFRNRLDHLITDHMKRHTPPASPKKSESVPPPPPKNSERIPPPAPSLESRKLTPAQSKAAGLPKAPRERKAKAPAAPKPVSPEGAVAKKVAVKKPKAEVAAPEKPVAVAKKAKTKKIKTEAKGE
jgi:hypothetical protein